MSMKISYQKMASIFTAIVVISLTYSTEVNTEISSNLLVQTAYAENLWLVSVSSGSGEASACSKDNSCFSPSSISIHTGDKVIWANSDDMAHAVTSGYAQDSSGSIGTDYPHGFDSELLLTQETFSHTFETEGAFPYFCVVHPWMAGQVNVSHEIKSGTERVLDYPIKYSITGGSLSTVVPIVADLVNNALVISIDAPQDGKLQVSIPRELLDAKSGGSGNYDGSFLILLDGKETQHMETNLGSSTQRTLTISFDAGTSDIEIVGTKINSSYPESDNNQNSFAESSLHYSSDEKKIQTLENKVDDLEKTIKNLKSEIQVKETTLKQKETQIQNFNLVLEELEQKIQNLNMIVTEQIASMVKLMKSNN